MLCWALHSYGPGARVWRAVLDRLMSAHSLRRLIGLALRKHADPDDAAQAVASAIVDATGGAVRPKRGWVSSLLSPMIEGVQDRAMGCMDQAALALCRDLAMFNPFQLVEKGVFHGDDRVLDWHRAQVTQRNQSNR